MNKHGYRHMEGARQFKSFFWFFILALIPCILSPSVLLATEGIGISPLSIGWDEESNQYKVEYTVFNNTDSALDVSSIIVFSSKAINRWRGTAAVNLEADSDKTFVKSIPSYFMLKNDYPEITVKLYLGNYEQYIYKSSKVQKLSSQLVIGDKIRIILSDQLIDEGEDQETTVKQLVLGNKDKLAGLLKNGSEVTSVLDRVKGRTYDLPLATGKFKLDSGLYLMTVISNKLSSQAGNPPKKVIIEESNGHLVIKNPEDVLTLTGTLQGDILNFHGGIGSSMVAFSGKLIADNHAQGEATQKAAQGVTYTATFTIVADK
jgi:hypothetical protein